MKTYVNDKIIYTKKRGEVTREERIDKFIIPTKSKKKLVEEMTEQEKKGEFYNFLNSCSFGSVFVGKSQNENEDKNIPYVVIDKKDGKIIATPCGDKTEGQHVVKLESLGFDIKTSTYLEGICEIDEDSFFRRKKFSLNQVDKKRLFSFLNTYYNSLQDINMKNKLEKVISTPQDLSVGDVIMNPYDRSTVLILNADKDKYYAVKLDGFSRYSRETLTEEYDFENMVFLPKNECYKFLGTMANKQLVEILNNYVDYLYEQGYNQGKLNEVKHLRNMIIIYKNNYYYIYSNDNDDMKGFRLVPVLNETDTSISISNTNFEPLYKERIELPSSSMNYGIYGYATAKEARSIPADIIRKSKIGKYRTK